MPVRLAVALVALAGLSGCALDSARIQIVERPNTLETRKYSESFDQAYYDLDASGNLSLVLRKTRPESYETPAVSQTILVESVWRSIPGTTVASSTQINATALYAMSGAGYHNVLSGAGSLFFSENNAADRLSGSLDHATLESQSKAEPQSLFQRVELSGHFNARRDAFEVRRLANELKRVYRTSSEANAAAP